MKKMFYLLLLLGSFQIAYAQNRTISGVVTDAADGSTILGATVAVPGTTIGTITDIDGNYVISVPSSASELQVSFMGMETQSVSVVGKNTVNVVLSSSAIAVEEVVVVGFGAQKKESVVGSVVQAKGDELLKAGSVTTVSEALSGILPGVSTMQGSGQPGSTESSILIRGQSTWGDNNPLFIVDGVERSFNDVDPNEIESISVLKDASATAVFGVKAANGVILITTKRGSEGKTTINYSGSVALKSPVMETDYMLDYPSALEYYNIAALTHGKYSSAIPQSEIDMWRLTPEQQLAWEQKMKAQYGDDWNYKYSDFFSYTNWIDKMIGNGYSHAHNLNVSGGNKLVKYFTSLGYNYDGDIFDLQKRDDFDPRTYQKRYNWRSNLDFDFTETTKLRVNIAGNFKDWHGNQVTAGWNSALPDGKPDADNVYNNSYISGMFTDVQVGTPPVLSNGLMGVGNQYMNDWQTYNYYEQLQENGEVNKRGVQLFSDIIFEQRFLKDFLFKGKVSYNFDRGYLSRIVSKPLYYNTNWQSGLVEQKGDKDAVPTLPKATPEYLNSHNNSLYYELSLAYDKTIADDHNVSVLALFHRRQSQSGTAFPAYEESWVGRATYNYKLKYMFEFNGAYTGSEKWAPDLRFGFFPSMALGWTISEEPFFKDNVNVIDFMKLRYSLGQVGSDIGARPFTYMQDYAYFSGGPTGVNGLYGYGEPYQSVGTLYFEGAPANTLATWETAVKQNLGLEMNMFTNRLKLAVDLFDEKRDGILMKRNAVSNLYGNTTPHANIGVTKNHGFEIDLKWNDRINQNWSYYASANISMSENRILEKDDPKFTSEYQKDAGKPIGWNKGYIVDGYLNSWDDVYNYTQANIGAGRFPGDFVYTDYNSDGVIDKNDETVIGNPSYTSNSFALNLGLSYKQWSLSALFNGAFGLSKNLSDNYLWPYATGGGIGFRMLDAEMLDYWRPDNLDASAPALHAATTSYNDLLNTYSLRASDYIRLKSLELKYTFKKETLHRLKVVEGLEMYVNGYNLLTFTGLPEMYDPESGKLEVYPITKRYTFGLRVRF